jgi:hypothetical protein
MYEEALNNTVFDNALLIQRRIFINYYVIPIV